MSGRQISRILNAILLFMGVTIAVLFSRTEAPLTNPSPGDTGPSGTAALRLLTERLGYRVVVLQEKPPRNDGRSVVIAPYSREKDSQFPNLASLASETSVVFALGYNRPIEIFPMNRLTMPVSNWGRDETLTAGAKVSILEEASGEIPGFANVAWLSLKDDTWIVSMHRKGNRKIIHFIEGENLSNRYLDTGDHASIFATALKTHLRKGDTVYFYQGAWNSGTLSFINALGSWALGGWRQILVIILVAFFAFSVRFGLARNETIRQLGGREAIESLGSLLLRQKKTDQLVEGVRTRVFEMVATKHRVSRVAIEDDPDRYLTAELSLDLANLDSLSKRELVRESRRIIEQLQKNLNKN